VELHLQRRLRDRECHLDVGAPHRRADVVPQHAELRPDRHRDGRRLEDHAVRGDHRSGWSADDRPRALPGGRHRRGRPQLEDAGRLAGAGPLRTLWSITLPLLRPALVTALTFRVLQSFGLFDLPFILTHGGPGHTTETVGVLAYDVLFGDLNFGAGAAISSLTTVLVLVAALIFFKVFGFAKEVADRD
jgi:hypothetical protein